MSLYEYFIHYLGKMKFNAWFAHSHSEEAGRYDRSPFMAREFKWRNKVSNS